MVNNTDEVRTERGAVESTTANGVTKGHAEVHGTRLYFERAGRGESVVFIHAGIADHRMWDAEFYALANDYQVIRYDLRGYGQSNSGADADGNEGEPNGKAEHELSFSHAQDLYILLRTLGVAQATLVGASMGGAAAIDFALEHPSMVHGLVLIGAVPNGYEFAGEMPPLLQQFVTAYGEGKREQAAELATRIWFDGPQRQPAAMNPELRSQVKEMMADVFVSSQLDFGEQNRAEQPAIKRLREIEAPTVVVIGDMDDESVQEAAILLADEMPAADRVQIDGAGHLLNLEKPDEFYNTVVDFLDRTADIDLPESDLATGLGGAVEGKVIAPEPDERR